MSEDQNTKDVAREDNDTGAVQEQEATPKEDKLLAGKFKTAEDLEKSYLELQSEYSRTKSKKPEHTAPTPSDDVLAEVEPLLNSWASKNGFVKKDELEAEKKEEENLNLYLASNPSAKARLDKIKILAKTDAFKGKSYAEIDDFLGGEKSSKNSKPVKMGSKSEEESDEPDTKSRDFWLKKK